MLVEFSNLQVFNVIKLPLSSYQLYFMYISWIIIYCFSFTL